MFSPMGTFMTELYPTRCAASARASATTSAAASARCSRRSSVPQRVDGLGEAIAVFGISAYALMVVSIAFLPETAGRSLTDPELTATADSQRPAFEAATPGITSRPLA